MATSTTNLGLIKPAGTDKIRIAQINSNMDVIDTKMGAVGNTPLQTQITTLNNAAAALESGAAIRATGNTHAAITSGQYVYVRNHSTLSEGVYTANSAIAANADLSTSNLTAVSGGGLNALNSKIDSAIIIRTYQFTLEANANVRSPATHYASVSIANDVNTYGFVIGAWVNGKSTDPVWLMSNGGRTTFYILGVAEQTANLCVAFKK